MLQVAGYRPQEVETLDLARMTQDDIVALLRDAKTQTPRPAPKLRPCKKLVTIAEMHDAVRDGWTIQTALPDGRFIVQGGGAESAGSSLAVPQEAHGRARIVGRARLEDPRRPGHAPGPSKRAELMISHPKGNTYADMLAKV